MNIHHSILATVSAGVLLAHTAIGAMTPADAIECRPRAGLPNVSAELQAGKTVRVAYLGGSITAAPGWRVLTTKWLQRKYPQAKIEEINAAIGGTGSSLGVYRNRKDVLAHKPDLLFVEFAVNDNLVAAEAIQRNIEGIVRQTWEANPQTDICFVYTIHEKMLPVLETGKFPVSASAMETVADHYGIPTIHLGLEAVRRIKEGTLNLRRGFAPDGCHPNAAGHQLYLEAIQRSFPRCTTGDPGPHELKTPLRADHRAAARMEPIEKIQGGSAFQRNASLERRFKKFMPEIWRGTPGESLTIKFKGTAIGFFDILGPDAGELTVSVDGGPERKVLRFDSYCTNYRMGNFMAAEGLPAGDHTVVVKVSSAPIDKAGILAKRGKKASPPQQFTASNWNVADVLLLGELQPPAERIQ